jgi:hypothetical protein
MVEVLDFVGNAGRHKLMTVADIPGGKYRAEVVDLATNNAKKSGDVVDVRKALEQAEEELERRRQEKEARRRAEAARRAKLVASASFSTKTINPFDALDIAPARAMGSNTSRPASNSQVELLRKCGVPNPSLLSHDEAGRLCGHLIDRFRNQKCNFKQAMVLKKYGYGTDATKTEASKIIDAIKAAGWRRPAEVGAL